MFALSTAWNADRFQDGKKIAQEIASLGIKNIELNFSLTKTMVEEIFRFTQQNQIQITSLHNYCPIPQELTREEALPDCFSLSSLNEAERKKAVDYTKLTISTAKRLSAQAVILHSGRVEIEDQTRRLIELYNTGQAASKDYQEIFEAFVKERKAKSPDYLAQILKSLKDLCEFAEKCNIVLGIENRFYYREIPSFEEFEIILDKFKNKHVAYWHDVGHAYIHEKLRFMKEGVLLKKYGSRLYGAHLHNIKNLADHQAPFDGEFDFNTLRPYVNRRTLKVLEVHSHVSPDMVNKSIDYLTGVFND